MWHVAFKNLLLASSRVEKIAGKNNWLVDVQSKHHHAMSKDVHVWQEESY